METIRFKTNIKCSGCVATVTPFLNEAVGENNWKVDVEDPSKVLTISANVSQAQVLDAIQKAGYKAESL